MLPEPQPSHISSFLDCDGPRSPETRLKRPKAAFAKLREAGTTRAGSVGEESIREPAMQIAADLM